MKQPIRLLLVVVGALVALIATVFSAYATSPGLMRVGAPLEIPAGLGPAAPGLDSGDQAPPAACSKMRASNVAWVTLTEDGDIDEQVDSYPSGTNLIVPVFEYNCVPKKVTVVTVFSLNGEAVFSDKESLKASNSSGLYGYPLGTTDGAPMDDGEWGVEFFNNKTLLTDGVVMLGSGGSNNNGQAGETVKVEGKVTDKKSKKPIRGAVILVLTPGVTVEDWVDGGQSEDDVFTAAKTSSKGVFTLESPLERNVEYSIIIVAKGYKPLAADGFVIDDEEEDPVQLNVQMSK